MYVYTSDGLRTIGLMTGSKELIEHLFKGSKGRIRRVGPRRTHRGTRGGTGRRGPIAIRGVERTEKNHKPADRRSRGSRCLIAVSTSGIKGPRQPETGSEITAEELNDDHYFS